MATTTLPASRPAWLVAPHYDLGWFAGSAIVPFVLFLPFYAAFGSACILPITLIAATFFGVPHNYLTWAVTLSPSARGFYKPGVLWKPLTMAVALTALLPLSFAVKATWAGISLFDFTMSLYTYIALWHVYKQHHGILKMYDAKYAATHGDRSHFEAFRPLYGVMAFGVVGCFAWVMRSPTLTAKLRGGVTFQLLHPVFSNVGLALLAAGFVWCMGALAVTLYRRQQAGLPLPVPQLTLAGTVVAAYVTAFSVVRPEDTLLAIALVTVFHNLQYWGFVWHYQRNRATHGFAPEAEPLDLLHRWGKEGKFWPYMGLAFAFSLVFLGLLAAVPPAVALSLVFFHNTAHHLADGYCWKRAYNPKMGAHLGL